MTTTIFPGELIAIFDGMAEVLACWIEWKQSHDMASAKISCCERSKALWKALDDYEALIRDDKNSV